MLTRSKAKTLAEQDYIVNVSPSKTGQGTHTRWIYHSEVSPSESFTPLSSPSLPSSLESHHTMASTSPDILSKPVAMQDTISSPSSTLTKSKSFLSQGDGWYRRVISEETPENIEKKMEIKLNAIREREFEAMLRASALAWHDPNFDIDMDSSDLESESVVEPTDNRFMDEDFEASSLSGDEYVREQTVPLEEKEVAPSVRPVLGASKAQLLTRTDTEIVDDYMNFRGASTPVDNGYQQLYPRQGRPLRRRRFI
ncbi:hypothetical protein H0H87_002061 [Tephrocybe sp. NHM501043]|nr:hypothetical protein H0H87_002061 [Tephrocybe sp. NHM501043]